MKIDNSTYRMGLRMAIENSIARSRYLNTSFDCYVPFDWVSDDGELAVAYNLLKNSESVIVQKLYEYFEIDVSCALLKNARPSTYMFKILEDTLINALLINNFFNCTFFKKLLENNIVFKTFYISEEDKTIIKACFYSYYQVKEITIIYLGDCCFKLDITGDEEFSYSFNYRSTTAALKYLGLYDD